MSDLKNLLNDALFLLENPHSLEECNEVRVRLAHELQTSYIENNIEGLAANEISKDLKSVLTIVRSIKYRQA